MVFVGHDRAPEAQYPVAVEQVPDLAPRPQWRPAHADLTEETLAEAHGLGLRVVPWTVNRPDDMRWLVRWGVDGLITDRPDLARGVLADEGLTLPPSRRAEEVGGR